MVYRYRGSVNGSKAYVHVASELTEMCEQVFVWNTIVQVLIPIIVVEEAHSQSVLGDQSSYMGCCQRTHQAV